MILRSILTVLACSLAVQAETVFQDDFANGLEQWALVGHAEGMPSVQDGMLELTPTVPGEPWECRATSTAQWTDYGRYELSFDVMHWHEDPENQLVRVTMPGGLQLAIRDWGNGVKVLFNGEEIGATSTQFNQVQSFRMVTDGRRAAVFHNGQEEWSGTLANDPDFRQSPSIVLWCKAGAKVCRFDNVKLDYAPKTALPPVSARWRPDLDNTPNLHTTTLAIDGVLKGPVAKTAVVELVALDDGEWRAERPIEAKDEIELRLSPEDFANTKEGKTKAPLHFAMVKAARVSIAGEPESGVTDVSFAWTGNDGVVYPWEKDREPLETKDGLTWWPGVDHNNGGHFAWRYEPNGLLINNVSFDHLDRSWYYFKPGRGKESFQFNFAIPEAKQAQVKVVEEEQQIGPGIAGLRWRLEHTADQGLYKNDQIEADWTTFRWQRKVAIPSGESYDQELRYSAMGVGVQVETNSPQFELSFQDGESRRGPAAVVLPHGDGVRLVRPEEGLDPSAMEANWLLLVADDGSPEIPVMVIFQHRPQRLEWSDGRLLIVRESGVGTLAMGTPYGTTVLSETTLAQWSADPKQISAERLARFAELLTAYPWTCHERFAVADGWVHVRNDLEFLPWSDDWATKPRRLTPLPPFVSYGIDRGILPRQCAENAEDLDLPTKWGPYWAVQGQTLTYRLPIPRMWDYAPLGTEPTEENRWLYDRLIGSISPAAFERFAGEPVPTVYPHGCAHDFVVGAWRSANYMPDDARALLREKTIPYLDSALFPQNYRYRRDPISGAQYLACTFVWMGEDQLNGEGWADIDYWQGIVLYGLYTNAKYAANWETMKQRWPVIRSMLSYWEALHSWALMGPGAREAGEIYGGDMATAGYAGLVGFCRLAERLGTPYQKDLAAYLLAKNAPPRLAMFGFVDWCEPMRHQELPEGKICSGFGELWQASLKDLDTSVHDMSSKDPWWGSGCIGPQSAHPEFLDLIAHWNRPAAVDWEKRFMAMCPNEGLKTHNDGNVIPHVMFRAYLEDDALRASAFDLLRLWHEGYMLRNTHAVASLLSWDCPVRLIDWSPAYVESARWDRAGGSANVRLTADEPTTLHMLVRAEDAEITADGQPVEVRKKGVWDGWRELRFDLPAGRHELTVRPK